MCSEQSNLKAKENNSVSLIQHGEISGKGLDTQRMCITLRFSHAIWQEHTRQCLFCSQGHGARLMM